MPLLLCPNDNSSMQSIQRSGVEFDMCPTCRGVWLDRGELEKLMAAESAPAADVAPPPSPSRMPQEDYRPQQGYDRPREGYDRPRYDNDDRGGYRKKKGSLFDIFD